MNKKLTSILLVLCMILSCVTAAAVTASAAQTTVSEIAANAQLASTASSYGLASKI